MSASTVLPVAIASWYLAYNLPKASSYTLAYLSKGFVRLFPFLNSVSPSSVTVGISSSTLRLSLLVLSLSNFEESILLSNVIKLVSVSEYSFSSSIVCILVPLVSTTRGITVKVGDTSRPKVRFNISAYKDN